MNILNRALTLLLKYHNHSHTSKLLLPDYYYYYFWSLIQRKHCTPEVQLVSNAVLTQVFNSFPAKRLCLKEGHTATVANLAKICLARFQKIAPQAKLGHPSPIYMNNQPLGNGLRFL